VHQYHQPFGYQLIDLLDRQQVVVKREHQIDNPNRGLVGVAEEREGLQNLQEVEGAGEEVHQKKAMEEVVGRSNEVKEEVVGRSIEVRAEAEGARCLLMEEEAQGELRQGAVEERRMLVRREF
jgi:hypothetical protein